MNIFVIHEDPRIAAQMHCDKHCNKMIVEHAQMLAAAYYSTIGISRKKEIPQNQNLVNELFKNWPRKDEAGNDWPYSISHVNHPCTIWTRDSLENFNWLLDCTDELCKEFSKRWNHKHSIEKILEWMRLNPIKLPSLGLRPFAQAMPICFKNEDSVIAYRQYYAFKPSYMKMEWRYTQKPDWLSEDLIQESFQKYQVMKESELLEVA